MARVRFIGHRLAALVGLLLILSVLLFTLQEISGADPVAATMGPNASHSAVAAERHRLGLDDPVTTRYLRYLNGLVHGDLGTSFRTRHPVMRDLRTYLPPTIELVLAAQVLVLLLALLFAVSSVLRWRGGGFYRGLLYLGSTTPTFLLGIAGLIVFYQDLGWLPASGQVSNPDAVSGGTGFVVIDTLLHGQFGVTVDALEHLVLPALALAFGPALSIGRVFRAGILATLDTDYVRTARSKGLTEWRVLSRHVVRNSLNGTLSMFGLHLGYMFAGVLVVENIFGWPGLGSYLGASIPVADFPAIAGVTFILATIYIASNTLVDILQSIADPRITA